MKNAITVFLFSCFVIGCDDGYVASAVVPYPDADVVPDASVPDGGEVGTGGQGGAPGAGGAGQGGAGGAATGTGGAPAMDAGPVDAAPDNTYGADCSACTVFGITYTQGQNYMCQPETLHPAECVIGSNFCVNVWPQPAPPEYLSCGQCFNYFCGCYQLGCSTAHPL